MKHFCVKCLQCGDEWIASYISEHGLLVAMDETGERCVDCGGEAEIGEEYEGGD